MNDSIIVFFESFQYFLKTEFREGLVHILRNEYRKGYDPTFAGPIANWDVLLNGVWIHYFHKPFLKYDSTRCLEQCNQVFRQGSSKEVLSLLEYFVSHIEDRQPSFLTSIEALLTLNLEKEEQC